MIITIANLIREPSARMGLWYQTINLLLGGCAVLKIKCAICLINFKWKTAHLGDYVLLSLLSWFCLFFCLCAYVLVLFINYLWPNIGSMCFNLLGIMPSFRTCLGLSLWNAYFVPFMILCYCTSCLCLMFILVTNVFRMPWNSSYIFLTKLNELMLQTLNWILQGASSLVSKIEYYVHLEKLLTIEGLTTSFH